jgi:hypothetical protein
MTEYHVFGDTGGHLDQLRSGLEAIGMNPKSFKLPKDTVVIHCGDLIHKGPDSPGVLALVDSVMDANPGRWIQLLGNHEFQYLRGAPTFWPQIISVEGQLILQSWLAKGRVRAAYAIRGPLELHSLKDSSTAVDMGSKGALFTHAGLTREFWAIHLEEDPDVEAVADRINGLAIAVVTTPGEMLTGFQGGYNDPVGPIWASGVGEVWTSWNGLFEMPFIQFHGHTAPYSYDYHKWWDDEKDFRGDSFVNRSRRFTATDVANSLQIAVDPGYSVTAALGPQPAFHLST